MEPTLARSVSLQRLGLVSLVLAVLYLTNRSVRIRPARRLTSFALWSLSETSSDRVRIHVATFAVDCPYWHTVTGPLCTYLRDQLAHNQPPLYDENDYPYTVHRSICWTIFVSSLLGWCWTSRSKAARLSRHIPLDALLDLLMLPLDTALVLIGCFAFTLYPTWMRMQTVILLQHHNSWFYDSFTKSVVSLLLLAVVGNALSRNIWNTATRGQCQLGRLAPAPAHALVAAMAGYYRGSFASDSFLAAPSHALYGSAYYAPNSVNWMLLFLVITSVAPRRRDYGIGIILSWVLTNMLAALFGHYQQEQQVLPVLANTVANAWREFWQSLVKS